MSCSGHVTDHELFRSRDRYATCVALTPARQTVFIRKRICQRDAAANRIPALLSLVSSNLSSSEIMEQPTHGKRKSSAVWEYFDHISETKVKCRICTTELSYVNKSTSSMLRHYRARHEHEVPETPRINSATRKQMLDEALLNFIVMDCQPLSIVESEGFRELVQVLEPSYVLPTRKTIKKILEKKYEEERERVKLEVQQAVAITFGNIWIWKWEGRQKTLLQMPYKRSNVTWQREM
nr:uncharacterized protein LOC133616769 [Nerophis lumbriciformis]